MLKNSLPKITFVITLFVMFTLESIAQEDDQITDTIISFDQTVEDTITERSVFDFWRFTANRGDVVVVTMQASDGLAPLIGIADNTANVLARSDTLNDGTRLPDAEVNGNTELEFEVMEAGNYTIIATRVGNQDGTTTGSYSLTLRLASRSGSSSPYPDINEVTFRCGEDIVQTALTIDLSTSTNAEAYRFSVYGLDDFDPHIRITAGLDGEIKDCGADSQLMGGDEVRFPDEEPFILEDEIAPDNAAQFSVTAIADRIRVTVASPEETSGRYLLIIDGMIIDENDRGDTFEFWRGPLATESDIIVYMLKKNQNRLDPFVSLLLDESLDEIECDDAGRFDCADVPAFVDLGVVMSDGTEMLGDRFSAGVRLESDILEPQSVSFSSRVARATGEYAVIVIGELPERASGE